MSTWPELQSRRHKADAAVAAQPIPDSEIACLGKFICLAPQLRACCRLLHELTYWTPERRLLHGLRQGGGGGELSVDVGSGGRLGAPEGVVQRRAIGGGYRSAVLRAGRPAEAVGAIAVEPAGNTDVVIT